MKRTALALAAFASLAATPAYAGVDLTGPGVSTPTINAGQSATVTFGGIGGSPVIQIPGLSAVLTLSFLNSTTASGSTVFNFLYSLTNTSTLSGTRVSSLGFNVDPNATSASVTGGYDTATYTPTNYPVGFGNVDVCFYDGPGGTCTGNGRGPTPNNTATGNLALTFAGAVSHITLSDFVVRYQAFNYNGISSGIGSGIRTGVPEPTSWALMILGVGIAGAATRRRRQRVTGQIKFA